MKCIRVVGLQERAVPCPHVHQHMSTVTNTVTSVLVCMQSCFPTVGVPGVPVLGKCSERNWSSQQTHRPGHAACTPQSSLGGHKDVGHVLCSRAVGRVELQVSVKCGSTRVPHARTCAEAVLTCKHTLQAQLHSHCLQALLGRHCTVQHLPCRLSPTAAWGGPTPGHT